MNKKYIFLLLLLTQFPLLPSASAQPPEFQRIPEPVIYVAPEKKPEIVTTDDIEKKKEERRRKEAQTITLQKQQPTETTEQKQQAAEVVVKKLRATEATVKKVRSSEAIVKTGKEKGDEGKENAGNEKFETTKGDPLLLFGLRGGLSGSRLSFSDAAMDAYDHDATTHGLFGFFFKIPLGVHWALRPEVVFDQRSDLMTLDDISYKFKARYLDLRLPVTFSIPLDIPIPLTPYLLAMPHLDFVTGGKITYSDLDFPDGMEVELSKANIEPVNFGLMLGAGAEWRIPMKMSYVSLALEFGYNWGFTNTFADNELKGATAADASTIQNPFLGANLWEGSRRWHGWEVALQVAVPLVHKKVQKPVKEVSPLIPGSKDTIVIINKDTVYVLFEGQPVATEYQTKECYSVKEIHDLIDQGVDISNKRICLFNINFAFDSYSLEPDAKDRLIDLLLLMRSYPEMTLTVYGHTDSRGTEEYNLRLSEFRANSVAAYLIENGISPSRIRTYGMGKRFPLASGEDEGSHSLNRRVEVEVNKIGRKYRK